MPIPPSESQGTEPEPQGHTDQPAQAIDRLVSGAPLSTLFLFAMPALVSNVLHAINSSINAIWVGRLLGTEGLAATTNGNLIVFLMFALVFGLGMAGAVLIGQAAGSNNLVALRRAVGAGVGLFILLGTCAAVLGWIVSPLLITMLATPEALTELAESYLRVMFLGLPTGLLTVYLAMALRGTGDALSPMLLMIPGAIIDVVLNPILIAGIGPFPELGIAGSATATFIANLATVVLMVWYIYGRDKVVRLRGREWRYLLPDRALLKVVFGKGVLMGLQMLLMSGSALVMVGLVNRYGTSVIAAYGAVNQLWTYLQMPAIAVGVAVSAMAAQNIGADRWDRVALIVRAGIIANLAMTGLLLGLLLWQARPLVTLFLGPEAEAIETALHINLIAGWSFVLFGATVVMSSAVRANGVTFIPLIAMTIALLPGRVGAAIGFEPLLGADSIWWSFPIGSFLSLGLIGLYYRYGNWRNATLLADADEGREFVHSESEPTGRYQPNG